MVDGGGDGGSHAGGMIAGPDLSHAASLTPVERFRAIVPSRSNRKRARFAGYLALSVTDACAILAGFWLAAQLRGADWLALGGINLGVATIIIYAFVATNQNAYSQIALRSVAESVRRSLNALVLTAFVVVLISFLLQAGEMISRVAFLIGIAASALGVGIGRSLTGYYYVTKLQGRLTDILLITDGRPLPDDLPDCTVIDARAGGAPIDLGDPATLSQLAKIISQYDRVIVSCEPDRRAAWSMALKGTHIIGELLMSETRNLGAVGIDEFAGAETMVVSRGPLSLVNRVKKRLFDLAIAIPALVALAPLLLVVAIAIKLESRGPVLFRQRRVGQSNALFDILKFRSMTVAGSDAHGARSASRDDDRITRVGRFIRATSIDELPQLFNVVRGEMSIVGPRPHALGSLAGDQLFWQISESYWMRHALKPGITGLAQIRGQRGATLRREDLEERLRSDLEYLNGWRLGRDIAIVLGTVRVLIHPNAY